MSLSSTHKKQPTLVTESEDSLIKGCIEWDRRAQNRLYDLFSEKMFAVCYKYSSSREEAEDTFHEGFMKVFENIKGFRREGSLEGWIRKIMVNTAIEKYRKNSHLLVVKMSDSYLNGSTAVDYSVEDILSRMEVKTLMDLIHKLPPQYKLVFNLYEFEGLKHKEIAERLGITVGGSKSNLSRAKSLLQRAVNEEKVIHQKISS